MKLVGGIAIEESTVMNGGSYFLVIAIVTLNIDGRSKLNFVIVCRFVTVKLRVGDGDISGTCSMKTREGKIRNKC